MLRLVALLRGINVGRGNRVEMARLRALLTGLGYGGARTYLQSGNVVFSCEPDAAATAGPDIEHALAREFGLDCRVIVRTADELAAAITADPLVDVATDPARHLVGFLSSDPDPAAVRALEERDFGDDRIRVVGRHAYLWCPAGVLASPLTAVKWERTLGIDATARNWNTVTKLASLANG